MKTDTAQENRGKVNRSKPGSGHGYVALLRGINVGGHRVINMDELGRIFSEAGFSGTKTLLQSGNVVFSSSCPDMAEVTEIAEKTLLAHLGYVVKVFLLNRKEMDELDRDDPFKGFGKDGKSKFYLTLMKEEPHLDLKLPLFSANRDLEWFRLDRNKAFVISRETGGRYGFPNSFIEGITGLEATTRNWNTIKRLMSIRY